MKALLINPWIADFAAYNFWIRPIGLYTIASWLYQFGVEVELIDCISPFNAPGKLRRAPRDFPLEDLNIPIKRKYAKYGISTELFRQKLKNLSKIDAIFITSVMSYWYPGIIWVLEETKKIFPSVPVILGGIYATLWPEHARLNLDVDLVCQGPLEKNKSAIKEILNIKGTIRQKPPWYKILKWDNVNYGTIRLGTGCPFSCTYCASRIISGGFMPFSTNEVILELNFFHEKGVKNIAFYDDALLVDFESRLKPVLKHLKEKDIKFNFHTPNGLHARLINKDVAKWLVNSGFKTIRLSLETVSASRQKATGGKVSNKDFEQAVKNLIQAGMEPSNIGAYLLIGLPGQDLNEVEEGIKFVKGLGIRPFLAEFSPIPGTVEWKRLEEKGLISKEIDPLLTNNTIYFRLNPDFDMDKFRQLKKMALI